MAAQADAQHSVQGDEAQRPRVEATGSGVLEVHAPGLSRSVQFVHMGSPLLWARSTGLKVWPGALLLAHMMLHDMDTILCACASAAPSPAALAHDSTAAEHQQPSSKEQQLGCSLLLSQASTTCNPTLRGSPAGAAVWGRLLSSAGSSTRWDWQDKRVIELGCGLGLCSIVASLLGAQVLATDGDADLVRILRKNAMHNTSGQKHPLQAATLLWGEDVALQAALCKAFSVGTTAGSNHSAQLPAMTSAATSQEVAVDVVLLSDVIYGSNPGIWERLVQTLLRAVAGQAETPTLILQCETRRLEGVLYDEYWQLLQRAGFSWIPLHDGVVDCSLQGEQVKAWAVWHACSGVSKTAPQVE